MSEPIQPLPDRPWRNIAIPVPLVSRIRTVRSAMMTAEDREVPPWVAVERGIEFLERQLGIPPTHSGEQYPGNVVPPQENSDELHAQNAGDPQ